LNFILCDPGLIGQRIIFVPSGLRRKQVEIWGTTDKIRSEDPYLQNGEKFHPAGESIRIKSLGLFNMKDRYISTDYSKISSYFVPKIRA